MDRLNSENSGILHPYEFYSFINNGVKLVWKIIKDHTDIAYEL